MPCYDPRDRVDWRDVERVQAELEVRTQQLCRALTILEESGSIPRLPPEDQSWWRAHQYWDARWKS